MAKNERKEIDMDRYFFNPKTNEKIFSHYRDGSEIELSEEERKKAGLAAEVTTKEALKAIEEDVKSRSKPKSKRGLK